MLSISHALYQAIRTHGERTYPDECCGVLLGHAADANHEVGTNQVIDAIEAGNTRTDSAHNRYHISPVELIRIQRQARSRSLDIVGFYHSHPDHPAMWSSTDLAEAHWLGCSYVITRVAKGAADVTNSFRLQGESEEVKHFLDEPIEIIIGEQYGTPDPTATSEPK